jgi:hypothetical protein
MLAFQYFWYLLFFVALIKPDLIVPFLVCSFFFGVISEKTKSFFSRSKALQRQNAVDEERINRIFFC